MVGTHDLELQRSHDCGDGVVEHIEGRKCGARRWRMITTEGGVEIDYQRKDLYILFLGTHAEYNRIDATEV